METGEQMAGQKKWILVWDLPVRFLHWALTILVFAALGSAMAGERDGSLFQIHILLGIIAIVVVVLRLIWGIIGSSYARFGSFLFGPKQLLQYMKNVLKRTSPRYIGHNPGSSWAIYAMLLFTLGLGLTGLSTGVEALEESHGPLAFLLLLVVVAHLAGIVWHTIRHRENIALSMVHGKKQGEAEQGLRTAHAAAGLFMLALTVGIAALLFTGHDPTRSRVVLPLVGTTITLGDGDEGGQGRDGERELNSRGDQGGKKD
jgi:cytochrome b